MKTMPIHLETDCLVIGSGVAGSTYALKMADRGHRCIVLSAADSLCDSNSFMAQGGIIYETAEHREALEADIQLASSHTVNPIAASIIATEGADIIDDFLISKAQVAFDCDEQGQLRRTREGAHSRPRIIFSKDCTGEAITTALHRCMSQHPNITIFDHTMAIDLLTLSHHSPRRTDRYAPLTCIGAYALDTKSHRVHTVQAQKTILATGGLGQLFRYTTNYPGAYGHGIAMAYRLGARVIDMEYVQFHPTVFAKKGVDPFLISEAVRGEGGVLVNKDGHAFMDELHPLGSLAARDIISRAIDSELLRSGEDSVYIDLGRMKAGFFENRFPNIARRCQHYGIDSTRDPIPVVPAAHYLCGGIHTDTHGQTNIRNLTALGENACTGLHGANRLASTSLLECLTFASRAATADASALKIATIDLPEVAPWESATNIADEELVEQDLDLVRRTMWNYVGLVRSRKRLDRAHSILANLKSVINDFYADCRLTPSLLNLRSAVQNALLVTYAASHNRTSCGCHYRED